MNTNLYHVYDLRGTTMEAILKAYTDRHGTPPQPLEIVCNVVDSGSVMLESVEIQKSVSSYVLPHNVFFGIEEKIDD